MNQITSVLRHRRLRLVFAATAVLLCGCGDDGGWQVHTLETDADFRGMQFLDSDNGWMVGGGYQIDGGLLGRTRDGGVSWTFRSGLAGTGQRQRGLGLRAIEFVSEDVGFIAGDRGVILKTGDGGLSWRRVHRGPRVTSHLSALFFLDRATGWAVGSGGLLMTMDAGETWRSLGSGAGGMHVSGRDVHFLNAENGFVAGRHGLLYRTSDAGQTWRRVDVRSNGETPALWDVHFVDAAHGWVVGEHGTVLATSDGGDSWSLLPGAPRLFLTAVRFLDPFTGWMVGHRPHQGESQILHTRDGGRSWEMQVALTGESLHVLELLDARHAWAIGDRDRDEPQKLLRRAVSP